MIRSRVRGIVLAVAMVACVGVTTDHAQTTSSFAAQIAALSEPAGYFDTDNLISNERSYLQVLPDLGAAEVHGGAYVGVGPDQNFTYIAEIAARDRLHRRRAARQPAAAPAVQGAVRTSRARGSSTSRSCSAGRCPPTSTAGARRRSTA